MNHLSLFSGIGGIDIAAHWAGFKTVAFVERDKFCQKVLAKNWPGVPIFDDVCKIKGDDYRHATVISGGFPCQPYSASGKQLGKDDNRALWPECLRIIKESGADWFVGENVIGLVKLGLDDVLASLEGIGYTARAFDIPARAVGAVHGRRRIFIVANSNRVRLENASFGYKEIRQFECGATKDLWVSELSEPPICRTNDGIPNRVDRLRALGNAVVPQQVYPIFKSIADIERAA